MGVFFENPRRAPRVPIVLQTSLFRPVATDLSGVAADIGPGGCLLVMAHPLRELMPVIMELRTPAVAAPLRVAGRIAWASGSRCGVRFDFPLSGPTPVAWFDRLVEAHPALRRYLLHCPSRLSPEATVSRGTNARGLRPLRPDEERILAHVRGSVPVQLLASEARLPPHYFARALFALLDTGHLVVAARRPLRPVAPRLDSDR